MEDVRYLLQFLIFGGICEVLWWGGSIIHRVINKELELAIMSSFNMTLIQIDRIQKNIDEGSRYVGRVNLSHLLFKTTKEKSLNKLSSIRSLI